MEYSEMLQDVREKEAVKVYVCLHLRMLTACVSPCWRFGCVYLRFLFCWREEALSGNFERHDEVNKNQAKVAWK